MSTAITPSMASRFTALFSAVTYLCLLFGTPASATTPGTSPSSSKAFWQHETFALPSKILKQNKIPLDTQREIWVWLPPSYHTSNKRYPVIYYIHNYAWTAKQMHEIERIHETIERAYRRGQTGEFIFVVGDYRATKTPGTFCGNNKVSGRWWDYTVDEVVPAIEKRYRTLAELDGRGLAGDYIGGYCAIRTAMERPGVFSSVYALHPVGMESGAGVMRTVPNWEDIHNAKSFEDLNQASGYSRAFVMMAQSHAPNANKPPFYADFMMQPKDGQLVADSEAITQLRENFSLNNRVKHSVTALKSLKGFMFDWGRYDPVTAHVRGAQRFTRELEEYDIPHYAEEYRGSDWSEKWIPFGRVEDRFLPFFKRFLKAPE